MRYFFAFLCLLAWLTVPAQDNEINRLHQQVNHAGDSTAYVDALNQLSLTLYENNVDSTFYYACLARQVSDRLNYNRGRAGALNNLGIVYEMKGDEQLALRYYNDAFSIYRSLNDSANIVQLLMNIGLVYNETGEFGKSINHLRQALTIGKHLRKDSIVSLVISNYISIYADSISRDSLFYYLRQGQSIAKHYNDERLQVFLEEIEGTLCLRFNEPQQGIAMLEAGVNKAMSMHLYYFSLDVILQLGDLYSTTDTAKAVRYYQQALSIAQSKDYHVYSELAAARLYSFYKHHNNGPAAQVHSDLLVKLYQEDAVLRAKSGVDYIDYALKNDALVTERGNSKSREMLIGILSVLLVVMLVTIFFIFRLYQLKHQHNSTLSALNESEKARNLALVANHEFNNRLISLLAHDFRQPLNMVKGLATLLTTYDNLSAHEMRTLVCSMEETADITLEIFENILQWIRRQLSGFTYQPEQLNLHQLVNEAIQPFKQMTEQYRMTIINEVDESLQINADKELVQFIHRNFIHNALKFSPERSTIRIQAHKTDSEIVVSVADEGQGIAPERLHTLFDFKTELRYNNGKEKGAGVALMICKDFTEKMRGRIWAENGNGRGAVFCYALVA